MAVWFCCCCNKAANDVLTLTLNLTTARLSHNTQVGPSNGTPIDQRNILLVLICSTANLIATNSAP